MLRILTIPAFLLASTALAAPSFSVNNATAAEDASSLVVTVRKHGRLNGLPSTVTLYTLDGTAKAGSDYVAQRATHSFTAAETSKKIVVGLVNDATPEGSETFTLKLIAGTNARLYDGTGIATITDTDVIAPEPTPTPTPTPTPAPVTWSPGPLVDGGYARILKAEVCCDAWAFENEVPKAAVGTVWYVIPGAKGWHRRLPPSTKAGWVEGPRSVRGLSAIDKVGVPFAGFYVYLDTIEGVVPSAPLNAAPRLGGPAPPVVAVDTDDSFEAVGVKRCLTGGLQSSAMSSVEVGVRYRVSYREAGQAYRDPNLDDKDGVVEQLVAATTIGKPQLGVAIVPDNCVERVTPKP